MPITNNDAQKIRMAKTKQKKKKVSRNAAACIYMIFIMAQCK